MMKEKLKYFLFSFLTPTLLLQLIIFRKGFKPFRKIKTNFNAPDTRLPQQ
jgi:hypothetical protein